MKKQLSILKTLLPFRQTGNFPYNPLKTLKLLYKPLGSLNRRQRWFFLATTLIILIPLISLMYRFAPNASATWFDDNFAYRKKITIGNSGSRTWITIKSQTYEYI